MRPEIELLLTCARTQLDSQASSRILALLQEEVDWDDACRLAVSHGVLPLFYKSLEAVGREAVPEAVLSQLRGFFRAHAQRNLLLTQELLRLLALLAENGVPAIPIKGPVLTALVYGNLALRPFGDLDLVVHPEDVAQAGALLISQGYRAQPSLQEAEWEAYVRSHRALNLFRADGLFQVDLQWGLTAHWRIHSSFQLDLERVWARLEPVKLAGAEVLTLAPQYLLLILCVHGTCHGWTELKLICDIAELVRCHPRLEWEQAVVRAEALGVSRMLYLGLRLAHDLLDAGLPDELARVALADQAVKRLGAQVRDWLFGPDQGPGHLFDEAEFHVLTRDRFWDRLRYALFYLCAYLRQGVVPTAEDVAGLPLPPSLTFLHYLIKPARMVAIYGLRPLKRVLQTLNRQLGE